MRVADAWFSVFTKDDVHEERSENIRPMLLARVDMSPARLRIEEFNVLLRFQRGREAGQQHLPMSPFMVRLAFHNLYK